MAPKRSSRSNTAPIKKSRPISSTSNSFTTSDLDVSYFTKDSIDDTNIDTLIDLINDNTHSKADIIHSKYRDINDQLRENDHILIQQLQEENERLQQKIEELNYSNEFTSPIRKNKIRDIDIDQERENISFSFDLLELMTGLKVINYEENDNEIQCDIRQTNSNKNIWIEYQLIINKLDTKQINYIPKFLHDDEENEQNKSNLKKLNKLLPDYLMEYLSFPGESLAQFYSKVSKALNQK
ncbi:CSM1 [Candida pseudojiufengensis]|uniref:CSM1 n=1 Tax=Candida pseudojiufengensis TaxID=497109 RepID=UPI0022254AE5|nr:CSM1 [Candida pseudojiufengensis]KAI5961818.1 CSM1 [Candida pseudojiufengensis]